jgi:hypothetical protein
MMRTVPGLVSKTWLSGINTRTIGGFYAFDSLENARAYATGMLTVFAKAVNASLTVKLFDGDVVAEGEPGHELALLRGLSGIRGMAPGGRRHAAAFRP